MEVPTVLDEFVTACRGLAESDGARPAEVRDGLSQLVKELVADPESLAEQVPRFDDVATSPRGWTLGGELVLHRSEDLTVMVLDTLPGVDQPPHDHSMVAIIGVFEGCEQQRFWARTTDGIAASAGRTLEAGDAIALGERAIHAISSPPGRAARAVHVYMGDIYGVERSLFNPDTLAEAPYSSDRYDEFCRASGF